MRGPSAVFAVLLPLSVLAACASSNDDPPPDAGRTQSASDGGNDGGSMQGADAGSDGGSMQGSDAGSDGGSMQGTDAGQTGTMCGLSTGSGNNFLWVAFAGGNLGKVHLDGEIDEYVGDIWVGAVGNMRLEPQAFVIDNSHVMLMRFGRWYVGAWPPQDDKLIVDIVDVNGGNESVTTLGIGGAWPTVYSATQGGTIFRYNLLDETVEVAAAGEASIQGQCALVDFTQKASVDATNFFVVGNCLDAPVNKRFKITGQLDTGGNLVSMTDVIGSYALDEPIIKAVDETLFVTRTELHTAAGTRPLRFCLNNQVEPLPEVRAIGKN